MDNTRPPERTDLALKEARRSLDAQFSNLRALDNKASILLGAAGVLLGLTPGLTSGVRLDGCPLRLLLLLLIVGELSTAFCLIAALWVTEWSTAAEPEGFDVTTETDHTKVVQTLFEAYKDAHGENRHRLTVKARWLKSAFVFFGVTLGLMAAAVVGTAVH